MNLNLISRKYKKEFSSKLTKTIDDKVSVMPHNERAHNRGDLKEYMVPRHHVPPPPAKEKEKKDKRHVW